MLVLTRQQYYTARHGDVYSVQCGLHALPEYLELDRYDGRQPWASVTDNGTVAIRKQMVTAQNAGSERQGVVGFKKWRPLGSSDVEGETLNFFPHA